MVSVFKSGSSSQGLSPGQGHRVVFLGQTHYFHNVSPHPDVQMGTGNL